MIGSKEIIIRSADTMFYVKVRQRFTIVKGETGSGKSYFVDLIRTARRTTKAEILDSDYDASSGRAVLWSDVDVETVDYDSLGNIDITRPCIYVIDEDICNEMVTLNNDSIRSFVSKLTVKVDGARKYSNCYFIFMCRGILRAVEYSVYELYHFVRKTVDSLNRYELYHCSSWVDDESIKADVIVTEGRGSDYAFFSSTEECNIVPANGKSNIANIVEACSSKGVCCVFVVADGAVFGSYYEIILGIQQRNDMCKIRLFLPHSFEYLVLKSGIVPVNTDILDNPEKYIDSELWYSYESYFENLLKISVRGIKLDFYVKKINGIRYHPKLPRYSKSGNSKFVTEILLSSHGVELMKQAIREIKNEIKCIEWYENDTI